ncbi:MAG: acyltransferase family protein, partial [Propylenella sp.]
VAPIRWLGEHSIVVYLAFFLPMAVSRALLLKLGIIPDIGTISVLVTLSGIAGPVLLYWLIQRTGFGWFLFERPAWARIDGLYRRQREAMVPAE